MNTSDKKKISAIIKVQIQALNKEIAELKEFTKPIPLDASIGRVSRMDAINNKAINDAALRDKEKLLKRLERTQDRIDEKDFGRCLKCGKEIPFGRLEYMPHATRCVSCAG
ncbi:MAG: TraR/DksA family transcriptional regulator [Balneola sp.]|nr:MAG: TraR/DksA family transcriptional regulator [Balneola sp.]